MAVASYRTSANGNYEKSIPTNRGCGARIGSAGVVLILDDPPIRLGQRFVARVEADSIPDGQIRTALECIRSPRGDEEQTLWSDAHTIVRYEVRGNPMAIPIDFKVPFDAPQTSERDAVVWRLSVEIGGVAGSPDAGGTFEVPVFDAPRM